METKNEKLEFKDIKVGSAYYFLIDDTNEGTEYRAYMYADKVNGLDNSISGWAYLSVMSTRTTCFPISRIRYYSFVFDRAKVRVAENIIYPMGLHNSVCEYVSDLEIKINEQLDLISKKLDKTTKTVKLREKEQFTSGYKTAMNRPLWKRIFKKV